MNLKNLIPLTLFISCCMFSETKLLVLGSGTPNPDPERSGSAYAVIVNGKSYLVDLGPGVVRRASSFSPSWGGDFESMETTKELKEIATLLAKIATQRAGVISGLTNALMEAEFSSK